jgi:hypothetical protein
MIRRRGAALAVLLGAAGLLAAGRGEAGMMSSCDQPAVFPGAALNVVILPYKADHGVGRPLGGPARELGLLIQLNSLLTLGRYGSLGAVYLHSGPDRDDCPVEEVADQLLDKRPGAGAVVQPGRAIILLWGRIYQEGPDIYLQTYLRFLQRGRIDGIERRLPGGEVFRARTPVQQVAFPPRRLSERDLLQIQDEFQKAARIYDKPDAGAPSEPLPVASHSPVAFSVDRVQDGWLQVSGEAIGTGKWLKAKIDPREWPLRQRMPELDFLDAVAGYLQYRVAGVADSGPGRPAGAIPRWVEESLSHYEEQAGDKAGAQASIPAALGKILRGNLRMLAGQPESAQPLYAQAAALLSYSADARNLEIVARLAGAQASHPGEAQEGAWLDALGLEPANLDVLENLQTLYGLASRGDGAPKDLPGKLESVRKVRAGILAKRPPEFGAPPPPP